MPYIIEDLTVNDGDIALGDFATFDLVIKSRWCKIAAASVVQLTAGAMKCILEVYESTAARDSGYARNLLYQLVYSRPLDLTAAQGGFYHENLEPPQLFKDRDAVDEERTYRLHCKLVNLVGGTASDFAVVLKMLDIGEKL